jgi:hypothetical protein
MMLGLIGDPEEGTGGGGGDEGGAPVIGGKPDKQLAITKKN